jgi:hypothetical protein
MSTKSTKCRRMSKMSMKRRTDTTTTTTTKGWKDVRRGARKRLLLCPHHHGHLAFQLIHVVHQCLLLRQR